MTEVPPDLALSVIHPTHFHHLGRCIEQLLDFELCSKLLLWLQL